MVRYTYDDGAATLVTDEGIGFAFMPCVAIAKGDGVKSLTLKITHEGKEQQLNASAMNGVCYIDYREYIQALFSVEEIRNVDYSPAEGQQFKSKAMIDVTIDFDIEMTDGKHHNESDKLFSYVWGSMRRGETWNGYKHIVWFKNYPFTFGVFTYSKGGASRSGIFIDDEIFETSDAGMYELSPSLINIDALVFFTSKVRYKGRNAVVVYGDEPLLKTITNQIIGKPLAIIDIDDESDDGVYLRWIDRHGFFRYWLFNEEETSDSVTDDSDFFAVRRDDVLGKGYAHSGANRRLSSRKRSVKVSAPLVDRDIFQMLVDMVSSPIVDCYINEAWESVTIEAGTYTMNPSDELQDFACNVIFTEDYLQRL